MFTRDRINRLLQARGFEVNDGKHLHDVLDLLDDVAGIDTRGGIQYAVFSRRPVPVNGLGARVEAHERLIFKPPPLMDDTCTCGCC